MSDFSSLVSLAYQKQTLEKALALQIAAAQFGFDWSDPYGPLDKVVEESLEVRHELDQSPVDIKLLREELGDLLFAVINVIRKSGMTPSDCLDLCCAKFSNRVQKILDMAKAAHLDPLQMSEEELNQLWKQVKCVTSHQQN